MTRPIPPILPQSALHYAWGLTLSLSGLDAAHEQGLQVSGRMAAVRRGLEQASDNPLRTKDLAYADAVLAAVESTLRNLSTVLQGRNKNFEEVDALMKAQVEKIDSLETVSLEAQSAIPRVFATGSGFSAPFVVLSFLGINLPAALVASLGAVFAGIFYGAYQLVIAPILKGRVQKAMTDADYRRNLYYVHYIKQCQAGLFSLFNSVLDIYLAIYGASYDPKFDDPAEVQGVVGKVLGDKVVIPRWCPFIHKHYQSNVITPDLWSSCESAEGVEFCPHYQREVGAH